MDNAPLLVAAIAIVGAVAAGAMARTRPIATVGVLFLLASISRLTLDTPIGSMRLEQPAIAAVAVVLLMSGSFAGLRDAPPLVVASALGFAAYLAVLAASSAFMAPDRGTSLRLVIWLAVSMAGGLVTYLLVRDRSDESVRPLVAVGAAKAAVGIAVAVLFLMAGPGIDLGIQDAASIEPRVHAFTWEANLYASFLAICIPLAIELARRSRSRGAIAALAIIVVSLPLGGTRGAYLGAAAGVIVYIGLIVLRRGRIADAARWAGAVAGVFAIGLLAAGLLLPNAAERSHAQIAAGPSPSVAAQPSSGPPASGGGSTVASPPGPTPSPTSSPSPTPTLAPYPDTISFRLDRVPIAFADLGRSPWIGLGAESFGQRHGDATQAGAPDHIAILAVAAVYDAGVLGAIALALGFALLLVGLWQATAADESSPTRTGLGTAAAFFAAIVAMLVCYEATNALHFAINWIVIGAAAAVIDRSGRRIDQALRSTAAR